MPGAAPLSSEAGRRRRLLAMQGWMFGGLLCYVAFCFLAARGLPIGLKTVLP